MYGRIPYLNISLSSWAIHCSNLRYLRYYSQVCSGTPLSAPLQRPRLFPTFVVNFLSLWGKFVPLQVTLFLLCTFLTLMTRDWGTIHKLKPRLFIKVILCSDVFFCLPELSFGFSIIAKYYLFSKVVQYIILEYTSIYYSSPLSSVCSILDKSK